MEANGQPQDPATFPLGKEPSLHTEQVAGFASVDLDFWRKEKFLSSFMFRDPHLPARSHSRYADYPSRRIFLLRKIKTTIKRGRRRVHTNSELNTVLVFAFSHCLVT